MGKRFSRVDLILATVVALTLAGCAPVGPDFVKLTPDAPAEAIA